MNFDLTQPITWSDIISASASLATFIAVIVAMVGNRNGSKQLKASLKIQEQSKNVELLELRIKIIESLKNNDQVSQVKIKLLFSEEVYQTYQKFLKAINANQQANADERKYFRLAYEQLKNPIGLPENDDIEGYLRRLAATENDVELKKFADANEVEEPIRDNDGNIVKTDIYNYEEIWQRQADTLEEMKSTKEKFFSLAEQYISDSIAPVTDKKHG